MVNYNDLKAIIADSKNWKAQHEALVNSHLVILSVSERIQLFINKRYDKK